MPAAIDNLSEWGRELISHSRAGVTEIATNKAPARNTQPSASRQS